MKAGSTYRILLPVLLWMATLSLSAQTRPARVWASVQFNKTSVVVGEPLLVSITVYTSTWFTAPPEFSEIQVPEAMMVDYQQRTGSMRKTIANKSYPAIEKKYVVYPFRVGENALPSLTIVVESPPEGDYKGRKRTIKSPERNFTVLPPADGMHLENWLTAFSVSLTERWDRPLDQLKQGDVPERQISIRASGALAALIPPLELPHGSFGNVYSKPASLDNVQNQTSFTGTRTEHWTYLLEAEGRHIIPGIEVRWYDPQSSQVERVGIEDREIIIAENPNMDFLLSMQDSLQAMLESGESVEAEEAFEWMGLNWWQLTVLILTIVILVYLLSRMILRMASRAKERKIASRESEEWYFERLMKVGSGSPEDLMLALLSWYDRFREERFGPTLQSFICASGSVKLRDSLSRLEAILYSEAERGDWQGKEFLEALRLARKKAKSVQLPRHMETLLPLNPLDEEVLQCMKRE